MKSPLVRYTFLTLLFLGGHSGAIVADERLWVYTRSAETLPKGVLELIPSVVSRRGKVDSDYVFNDIRFEAEYGFTDKLIGYAEIMVFNHDYSTTNPDLQPYWDTQGGEGGRFSDTQFGGYELGLKYNILSPFKDAMGLSIGGGYDRRERYRLDGADISQNAFNFKLFFQMNFLDDQLILAFSPKIEWEVRFSPGIKEEEYAIELPVGISYRFARNWNVGLEFRHQSDYLSPYNTDTNEYEDPTLRPSEFPFTFGTQHQNGNYLGPTLHYSQKNWWVTGGILWQIFGGGSHNAFNRHNKNWDEHERVHVGLFFGFEFDGGRDKSVEF